MKKRLLITSIVMMLVVAVALSTATYAWFTANTTVKASSISITAGTSLSSALGIAWNKSSEEAFTPAFNNDYGTYVVAVDASTSQSGGFQPAAPAALTNAEPTFHTAFINAQGLFKTTPGATATDVYRFANAESGTQGFSDLIHIANLAQNGTISVTVSAEITPALVAVDPEGETVDTTNYNYYDANKILIDEPTGTVTTGYKASKNIADTAVDLVRIAIFEVATTGEAPNTTTTYTYKGLLSNTAATPGTNNTAVGTITAGNSAAALVSTTGAESTATVALGNLGAQEDKAYAIYVWLDGALFDEARGGQTANVSLTFASQQVA